MPVLSEERDPLTVFFERLDKYIEAKVAVINFKTTKETEIQTMYPSYFKMLDKDRLDKLEASLSEARQSLQEALVKVQET